ncbi:hypothetical protein NQ314_003933 [Rhamnusium bicolor]|uniref:Integrase p58-like C-terminal domain-containing protein n=1 Tax=Rhamnusium bicolor TaxID=1586634 RepID=A0AAV8ZMF2_9CUCU|nr:hypothetical protein NQ314_003933 [Rhamnusium bicolor]
MLERSHRVFKDILSQYISNSQQDWDDWVPLILFAYRTSIHSATGYSPYFIIHSRDPILLLDDFIKPNRPRYDYDENYASELLARLSQVFINVRENLARASDNMIKQYNKKTKEREFELGDLVYLHDPTSRIGISKKLAKLWLRPYRILEKKEPVNYKISEVGKRKDQIIHVNRLKHFRRGSVSRSLMGILQNVNYDRKEELPQGPVPEEELDEVTRNILTLANKAELAKNLNHYPLP